MGIFRVRTEESCGMSGVECANITEMADNFAIISRTSLCALSLYTITTNKSSSNEDALFSLYSEIYFGGSRASDELCQR